MPILKNYHAHTYRCKHASGDVADYVRAALNIFRQVHDTNTRKLPITDSTVALKTSGQAHGALTLRNRSANEARVLGEFNHSTTMTCTARNRLDDETLPSGEVNQAETATDAAGNSLSNETPVLGFSDHSPLPDGRWPKVRMDMGELDGYDRAIESSRSKLPGITILKAMECEWVPEFRNFYQDELLGKRQFQYLVGAVHWIPAGKDWKPIKNLTPKMLIYYADHTIELMESGLFAFVAHPDMFVIGYPRWDDNSASCSADILRAAEELKIPLEINGYGFRKSPQLYPWLPFWELASEFDIRVICNSDAHSPEDVFASIDRCEDIAARYELAVTELETESEPVAR